MAGERLDVVGIGNAIVDVLARADERLLGEHSLDKGAMTLVDAEQAHRLYESMGPGVECSGGSAANTMAGLASLGGRAGYVGKVADDELGRVFSHDIRNSGVRYSTEPLRGGPPTARCLILVTPDAQRTMQTFLGASVHLGPADIDAGLIRSARVTYLEGYLWDPAAAKEAFLSAASIAHEAGSDVSLTLSDAFCVDRHRESFIELVRHHVDILFANEAEITSLYQVDAFEDALQHVRGHCRIAALTRGDKGSVIVANGETHVIEPYPVAQIVDTTGAGDLFAAGFLRGYTQDAAPDVCGRIGSIAASEIISHFGARPATNLAALVRERLG